MVRGKNELLQEGVASTSYYSIMVIRYNEISEKAGELDFTWVVRTLFVVCSLSPKTLIWLDGPYEPLLFRRIGWEASSCLLAKKIPWR
jgi:hypothetical protein